MSCDCQSSCDETCGLIGRADLCIPQGATWIEQVLYEVGDPLEPVDLTGYTAELVLVSDDETVRFTSAAGDIILGGDGTITWTISDTVTAALESLKYQYSLVLTIGSEVTRLLEGYATVIPSIAPAS